ncbi:MAG TPA: hypothetical protein VKB21_05375 [Candidatus Acidoferrum sp.]|nr:hypothetical protein [Candidatus Acidoferrum sp.]
MHPSAPSMESATTPVKSSASTPVTAATLRHYWLYQPNGRDCERYANYP